jgi:hypothetical protein
MISPSTMRRRLRVDHCLCDDPQNGAQVLESTGADPSDRNCRQFLLVFICSVHVFFIWSLDTLLSFAFSFVMQSFIC